MDDLWPAIVEAIVNPASLRALACTCSWLAAEARRVPKERFVRVVDVTNEHGGRECYLVLPNGKRHGEFKRWYADGPLFVQCFYVDDRLHGEYKQWYANGQLSEQCVFVDGKQHGEFKSWYHDGELCTERGVLDVNLVYYWSVRGP